MSNDYCTCYKLKGETDGIKRLAAIVRRIRVCQEFCVNRFNKGFVKLSV